MFPPLKYDGAASLFIMLKLKQERSTTPQMGEIWERLPNMLDEDAQIGNVVVIDPQRSQLP
jgi:hypothetical protein